MKKQFFFFLLSVAKGFSLPLNPQIISGEFAFQSGNGALEVTCTDRGIVRWDMFDILPNESVYFHQSTPQSVVVNKVFSENPSLLFGSLGSNGKVVLINSNGLLIGKSAQINMGSFVASSFGLNDKLYLSTGKCSFSNPSSGKIINEGVITTFNGSVALIGSAVENSGNIFSSSELSLIAGREVDFDIDGRIKGALQISTQSPSKILHQGLLKAEGHEGVIFVLGDELTFSTKSQVEAASKEGIGGNIYLGGVLNDNFALANKLVIEKDSFISSKGNFGQIYLFAEEMLSFLGKIEANEGMVKLFGKNDLFPHGEVLAKTLFVDPTNITVTVLDAAAYSATLNLGTDVIISACAAGPDPGTILVSTGANILWTTTADLTLQAPSDITILGSIQNDTGAGPAGGDLFIQCGGTLFVNTTANTQNVSIGSRHGLTKVSCLGAPCAGSNYPNVILQGGTAGGATTNRGAQIGFYPATGDTATGPIEISCNQLQLLGGRGFSGAQIGHGRYSFTGIVGVGAFPVPIEFNTTAAATISIEATGNVLLQGGISGAANQRSTAIIGHGAYQLGLVNDDSSENGNIYIAARGDLTLNGAGVLSAGTAQGGAYIGHGATLNSASTLGPMNGSITLQVGSSIALNNIRGDDNRVIIGHHVHFNAATSLIESVSGDIIFNCPGNLTTVGSGSTNHVFIGHHATRGFDGTAPNYLSNIHGTIGGSVNMSHSNGSQAAIGWSRFAGITDEPSIVGHVALAIGGDLLMAGGANASNRQFIIGYQTINPASFTDTFVGVTGNIGITNASSSIIGIAGWGNVYVAAGGNINVTGNPLGGFPDSAIGTTRVDNTANPPAPITRIYAGGSIIGTTNAGFAFFGYFSDGLLPPIANRGFSLEVRAGEDVQMPFHYEVAQNGSILLEADANFAAGELWISGASFSSVANAAIAPAIAIPGSINFSLGGCPVINPLIGASPLAGAISATTPAVSANGLGGLRAQALATQLRLQTTSGNITLHSAPLRIDSTGQDLTVGVASTNFGITTTSGNIEIWGSIPQNSFQNVIFDNTNAMMNTAGSIVAVANVDMTLNSNVRIQSTGSFVSLVVDNEFSASPLIGPGAFTMSAGSEINSGVGQPLRIFTSQRALNTFDPTAIINGTTVAVYSATFPFYLLSPLFENTSREIWCTYFNSAIDPHQGSFLEGIPFTVFYKDCIQELIEQAMIIADQLLVNLHPYNEFPGWAARFNIDYEPWSHYEEARIPTELFILRRRHLNFINHPKSWTQQLVP